MRHALHTHRYTRSGALERHDLEQLRTAFSVLVETETETEPEADIDDATELADLFGRTCSALASDEEQMPAETTEAIDGRRGGRPLGPGATYAEGVDAAAYLTDDLL